MYQFKITINKNKLTAYRFKMYVQKYTHLDIFSLAFQLWKAVLETFLSLN